MNKQTKRAEWTLTLLFPTLAKGVLFLFVCFVFACLWVFFFFYHCCRFPLSQLLSVLNGSESVEHEHHSQVPLLYRYPTAQTHTLASSVQKKEHSKWEGASTVWAMQVRAACSHLVGMQWGTARVTEWLAQQWIGNSRSTFWPRVLASFA